MIVAFLIALLYIIGFYLLLRRSLIRAVLGMLLISHGVNLLLLVSGGLQTGLPLIEKGNSSLVPPHPDPLPQALILTAIVISLGVTAYLLALIRTAVALFGSDNSDDLQEEV